MPPAWASTSTNTQSPGWCHSRDASGCGRVAAPPNQHQIARSGAISLASRIGRHEQPQSLSERHHHSRDGLRRDSNPAYARAVLQLRQAARRFALSYQLPPARTGMTWSTTDARP
jgi:hypothetical protein